eukprot:scaffold2107_cov127-Isochrysis_galbana.AAC.5
MASRVAARAGRASPRAPPLQRLAARSSGSPCHAATPPHAHAAQTAFRTRTRIGTIHMCMCVHRHQHVACSPMPCN